MEINYKEKLKSIRTFIFDVDGVFTDNTVYLGSDGEQMRTANVRDGYAVQLAVKKGFQIVILSGGNSTGVAKRFDALGVKHVFLGAANKLDVFHRFLMEHQTDSMHVCYMGDDIPDYRVMKECGLACCPADAASEIKSVSHYISPYNGGKGCVRDILEQALKVQKLWMDDEGHVW